MNLLFLVIGVSFLISIGSLVSMRGQQGSNKSRLVYQTKCEMFDYPITNITLILFFTQVFMNVYLLIKYSQPEFFDATLEVFIYQNVAILSFSPVGLLIYQSFYGLKYSNLSGRSGDKGEGMTLLSRIAIFTPIAFLAIAFFQVIIIGLTKISISNFDLFLFFGATAISEEFLFRYGIQLGLEKFFKTRVFSKLGGCEYLSVIFGILISSLVFASYHYFVKNSTDLLLAVLVSGIILGITLRLSKSIDACIIAHFFVNIIVTWVTIGPPF